MKSGAVSCWRLAALTFLLGFVVWGCAPRQPTPPPEGRELLQQLEAGAATREAVEAELKAMDVPKLVKRLEADAARGVEPFNSLAYPEFVSRGPGVGEALASSIKAPDRTSFLTLLALREVDRDRYRSFNPELGIAILVDALGTSEYFNAWGMPHLYWEDASEAIIEYDELAIEPLRQLLDDNREAPVWGSEEVLEYNIYKYRVKDYAWALLMEIKGVELEVPIHPAERDNLIGTELRR